MAIGAKDTIEQELVFKYSKIRVDNPENSKLIDTETMLNVMQNYSNMRRDMMSIDDKLKDICANVTLKSVKYMRIYFNPPRRR